MRPSSCLSRTNINLNDNLDKISRPQSSISRYRIKSCRNSEIDETLFGNSNKNSNNNNIFCYGVEQKKDNIKTKYPIDFVKIDRPKNPKIFNECFDKLHARRILSQDNVRYVYVDGGPSRNPSLTITSKEYDRLLNLGRDKTKEMEQQIILNEKLKKESFERFKYFSEKDLKKCRETISENDKEKMEKSRKMIKKAWEERINNEEEVRVINNLIKEAKLESVRKKQIAEKKILREEEEEEEKRLNEIMEKERQKQQALIEEQDKKRKEQLFVTAHTMIDQIEEKRQKHLQELAEQSEENIRFNQEISEKIQRDEEEKQRNYKEWRERNEKYARENKTMVQKKKLEIAQEMEEDKKIVKYWVEKEAKEKEIEEKEEERKRLREIEFAKMRAAQKRDQDLKAMRDELIERRSWEAEQRRWREKELMEIKKKKLLEEEIRVIRQIQHREKIKHKILEIKEDKKHFEHYLKVTNEEMEKEKWGNENEKSKRKQYINELLKQIDEQRRQRLVDCYEKGLEEQEIENELKKRKERIEKMKLSKLNELKNLDISDRFIKLIEYHCNNPFPIKRN